MASPPPTTLAPPTPLRGTDGSSFAHYSIVVRLPEILRRVLDENPFPPGVQEALQQLHAEIPSTPLYPIDDPGAPDVDAWTEYVERLNGATWLEAPWFFAETYFYRRIIAATGYFSGPLYHEDPFRSEKETGLRMNRSSIRRFARRVSNALRSRPPTDADVQDLIGQSLWGNRADLSLWAADEDKRGALDQPDDRLLADHRQRVVSDLIDHGPNGRLFFVADNAGLELVGDLCLLDALLSGGVISTVTMHVKSHPTFVSDVVIPDVGRTIAFLRDSVDRRVQKMGGRLQEHRDAGRILVDDDPFWTSPHPLWDMPERIADPMRAHDLTILKGDANYRRMLGDRHWPYTTPLSDATAYLPAPTLALRTMKAEVAVGLSQKDINRAAAAGQNWAISGEWGLIQYAGRPD
ncbi:damage-control phosphatase ARMT1 family protein [Longibacter sp.]|uniref:damage-control phosphatase ARMT1 family protein n=1 Tax=Longibacter sp. TaxID=2045415 RepID=UPI003EBE824B